jgi:hypothetical protein
MHQKENGSSLPMIGDLVKGEEIRKGGGGVDREAVREVFLPRREDCLEYLRKKRWKEGIYKATWTF